MSGYDAIIAGVAPVMFEHWPQEYAAGFAAGHSAAKRQVVDALHGTGAERVRADEVRLGDRLFVDGVDEGNVTHIEQPFLGDPFKVKIVSHAQKEQPSIVGGWHLRCAGERVTVVRP